MKKAEGYNKIYISYEECTTVIRRYTISVLFGLFLLAGLLAPAVCISSENTIGVIMTGDIPYYQELHQAFMDRLVRDGISSRTSVIVQKPYPDAISLSNAARKLIATDVDVIIAYGAPAASAVLEEKSKIPLVYAAVYEPMLSQLKMKNSTGITVKLSVSSLFRYLRGLKQITTLAVVYSSAEEDSVAQFAEISKLAGQYGIKIEGVKLRRHLDVNASLSALKVDAILVTGSSIAHMAMPAISEFARARKAPLASFMFCRDSHAVITLATSPVEQGEKAAGKAIKILEGTSPEKIRAETAHNVELIFNFREATAMGWKLPMELVTQATRLIK